MDKTDDASFNAYMIKCFDLREYLTVKLKCLLGDVEHEEVL